MSAPAFMSALTPGEQYKLRLQASEHEREGGGDPRNERGLFVDIHRGQWFDLPPAFARFVRVLNLRLQVTQWPEEMHPPETRYTAEIENTEASDGEPSFGAGPTPEAAIRAYLEVIAGRVLVCIRTVAAVAEAEFRRGDLAACPVRWDEVTL